jgi:hypothetical protein
MHKQISKNYYYKYKPIKKPLTLLFLKKKKKIINIIVIMKIYPSSFSK